MFLRTVHLRQSTSRPRGVQFEDRRLRDSNWLLGLTLTLGLITSGGCESEPNPKIEQVATAPLTSELSSDTQHDLGHVHRHLHGDGQRHDHEHQDFEGAHEHPHQHGHRHAPAIHGGKIVAIGHTDHKSPFRNHYHAEVTPISNGQLDVYLSCIEAKKSSSSSEIPDDFAPTTFSGTLSAAIPESPTPTGDNSVAIQFTRNDVPKFDCIRFTAQIPPAFRTPDDLTTFRIKVDEIILKDEAYGFATLIPSNPDAQH
ncbi:MAG: hypothetical protein ACE361_22685 [Aureliella sp.]